MPELDVLPQSQVIRLIAQADKREFTLFLGAGASRSSGVPLASEMIREWRQMAFEERAPAGAKFDEWCKAQPWCDKDEEYSILFEMLFPNERARQRYVEPKIESAFPSWCYLYLANIVQAGYFNVIFTTNFDDLVNDALTMYLGYNPVVCAADSEVMSISITTDRAKVIKLHGDYLFKRLKNTAEDLRQLDPNMESKVKEFAKQCGTVVIGYAGRDHSVMRVLDELMKDGDTFPNGIYWGLRPNDQPAQRVKELAEKYPRRFHLFQCQDFDMFMVRLHSNLNLKLPPTIVQPFEAIGEKFNLNPQNAWYHFSLANGYVRLGRLDEATAEFNQAIQLEPNTLSYRLQVANFYWARQQPMLALPHMEAAITIEPNSAEAHGWLGQIYLALGRMSEAQREMDAALKLSPQDSRLLVNAGILYSYLNRPDLAEGYLRQAAQLNPSIPQPYYLLCMLYWTHNRVPDFNMAFQRLMQIAPPVAQQLQLQLQAMQMQFTGNRQAALQNQWLAWLQNQPQNVQPQSWLPQQPEQGNPQSVNDMLRAAWGKLSGSQGN